MSDLGVPLSPAVLVWARESSGATIDEAARRVGKSADTVERWERGVEVPPIGALEALADLYERPLAALLLPEPPPLPELPTDFRPARDRGGQPLSRLAKSSIRHAVELQTVLGEVGHRRSWQPVTSLEGSIDMAAGAERSRFDVGDDMLLVDAWKAFDLWRKATTELGIVVLQADIPLDDLRAASLTGQPPVVLINEHDLPESKQFSLFHEYGHLMVGRPGYCAPLARDPLVVDRDVERRCNEFAGAFLVPRDRLEVHLQLARDRGHALADDRTLGGIARAFRVSRQVIWYRLLAIGAIDRVQFQTKWAEWPYFVGRDPRPRRPLATFRNPARYQVAHRRLGRGVVRELISAESHGELELSDLLRYLDVPVEDIPKLESMAEGR